ncbi:MAG: hypothetical protein IJY04_04630 [Clostridia bacterium]|nr:hypothetical protein [Clostridia bacterium]
MTEKVNWEEIRAEYVSDSKSTYNSLGEKYGVSASSIAVRSRGENWRELRRKRSESISQMIIERRTQEDVERFMQVSNTASTLVDRIEAAVNDQQQFYRYIVDGRYGDSVNYSPDPALAEESGGDGGFQKEERIFAKMDTKALREMTAALRDALEIIRKANRIPTVEHQLQHELAMARLDFDRERFTAAMKDERVVQIRFDDGTEDYSV